MGHGKQIGIELDRRARLEHSGQIVVGTAVELAHSAEPACPTGTTIAGSASREHRSPTQRNVYVAVTDRGVQTATYVACFDADTGAARWARYVGAASPEPDNNLGFMGGMQPSTSSPGDFNHRLLSLDGSTLYYQTNLGAWRRSMRRPVRYSGWRVIHARRLHQLGGAVERDLNPAVIHDGRVFIAPSDADAIFAFDSSSGRLLWKTERIADDIKLSHLLGVAKGRLVATGNRVVLIDSKTGKLLHAWPDSGKALDGYGRGLLAGDMIYWPTQNEIQVLDQRTGLRADPPIKLLETYHAKGGNLVAGDGYLIVAQADGLVVFCQNSRLIERYRQQIVRAPEDAANYFRLARAAEAIGSDQDALEMYGHAIEKAHAQRDHRRGSIGRRRAQSEIPACSFAWAPRPGKPASGIEPPFYSTSAGEVTRSANERLEAELSLADVLLDASKPRDAVAICQRLLSDDRLRNLPVAAADGHRTVRADLLIADRLKSIVGQHGRAVYAAFDEEAAALFERGKKEKDPRVLDHLCRAYPEARVIPDASSSSASSTSAAGGSPKPATSTNVCRPPSPTTIAAFLRSGGWRTFTRRGSFWSPRRDVYLELLARFPKINTGRPGRSGHRSRACRRRTGAALVCVDRR